MGSSKTYKIEGTSALSVVACVLLFMNRSLAEVQHSLGLKMGNTSIFPHKSA